MAYKAGHFDWQANVRKGQRCIIISTTSETTTPAGPGLCGELHLATLNNPAFAHILDTENLCWYLEGNF